LTAAGNGRILAGQEAGVGLQGKEQERRRLQGRRVLVVEDDWFIADAMASLLQAEGADVFGPAATVTEGTELAHYWPIDIALLDLKLQDEMADDLVVELAAQHIPVVVVTAHDIKQPVADSAFATLHKPVAQATLIDTLYRAAGAATPR
jgi:DNA-binding response OmpR family regulator